MQSTTGRASFHYLGSFLILLSSFHPNGQSSSLDLVRMS